MIQPSPNFSRPDRIFVDSPFCYFRYFWPLRFRSDLKTTIEAKSSILVIFYVIFYVILHIIVW